MNFWIPAAENDEQAEQVYNAICKHVSGIVLPIESRIRKLFWEHNGKNMECEVGQPLDSYYGTGNEPVVAIIDCTNLYKVCTPSRGVIRGDGIWFCCVVVCRCYSMTSKRVKEYYMDFSGHRFEKSIILLNVRWYLSYQLSYCNLLRIDERTWNICEPYQYLSMGSEIL